MTIESNYYKEKLLSLFDKLFIETGDARSRFKNCENKISAAYEASKYNGVPSNVKNNWEKMWCDLNTKEELITNDGKIVSSSFFITVSSKKNKTMEKYLLFILEEFCRLYRNQYLKE